MRAAPRAALASRSDGAALTGSAVADQGPQGKASAKDLLKRGRRAHSRRLTACYLMPADSAGGLVMSIQKRFLKSAVQRNAVKRQIRELVRLEPTLQGLQVMIMGRAPFLDSKSGGRNLKRSIRQEAAGLMATVVGRK